MKTWLIPGLHFLFTGVSLEVLKFVLGQSKAFALGQELAFDYNLGSISSLLNNHIVDKNNPHEVNASQINLSSGNSIQFEITNILNRLNGTGANQYMWRRYRYETYESSVNNTIESYGNRAYASSYEFDQTTGEFSLISPTIAEFSYDDYDNNAIGKYMYYDNSDNKRGVILVSDLDHHRIQTGIDGSDGDPIYNSYCGIKYQKIVQRRISDETILYSENQDGYQEGIHDGYIYEYLGVNTSNIIPSFAYGKYNGNGTHGESAQTSLQFSFKPVAIIITEVETYAPGKCGMFVRGQSEYNYSAYPYRYTGGVTFTDNSVSWWFDYSNSDGIDDRISATYQFNSDGAEYTYLCIGY